MALANLFNFLLSQLFRISFRKEYFRSLGIALMNPEKRIPDKHETHSLGTSHEDSIPRPTPPTDFLPELRNSYEEKHHYGYYKYRLVPFEEAAWLQYSQAGETAYEDY